MENSLISPTNQHSLALTDKGIPALFVHAGDQAAYRFVEFFTANIHNPNTRLAYYHAVTRFCRWCERHGVELTKVNPVRVARYVQELGQAVAAPTVKQHLAAIRTRAAGYLGRDIYKSGTSALGSAVAFFW